MGVVERRQVFPFSACNKNIMHRECTENVTNGIVESGRVCRPTPINNRIDHLALFSCAAHANTLVRIQATRQMLMRSSTCNDDGTVVLVLCIVTHLLSYTNLLSAPIPSHIHFCVRCPVRTILPTNHIITWW